MSEWATRRRHSEDGSGKQLGKVLSARTLARLMTTSRENLSKADIILMAAVEGGAPALVEARDLVDRFHTMIRTKAAGELDAWLQSAGTTLVASFARRGPSVSLPESQRVPSEIDRPGHLRGGGLFTGAPSRRWS